MSPDQRIALAPRAQVLALLVYYVTRILGESPAAIGTLYPVSSITGKLMYFFMVLYGMSNTGARLLPNAMAPDTADLDQARTGERREGAIFGIFVFVQQTGFAVGGFLLSLLLAAGMHGGAISQPHEPASVAILLTFTLASALLYGGAFAAILPYRMPAQPT
ncbi:MAG: MFS transporter [Steroidobacteraceae bacterium]